MHAYSLSPPLTLCRGRCHIQSMDASTTPSLDTICVYCGSGPGQDPAFVAAARAFGRILAENRIRLVYGGGSIGLMGELRRLRAGTWRPCHRHHPGLPDTTREHVLTDVQEVIVTRDMHERKQLMFEHADAFVALPGGVGTLEELVEQLTWSQLGRHQKPILCVNVAGFWKPLCDLLDHMTRMKFIREGLRVNFLSQTESTTSCRNCAALSRPSISATRRWTRPWKKSFDQRQACAPLKRFGLHGRRC